MGFWCATCHVMVYEARCVFCGSAGKRRAAMFTAVVGRPRLRTRRRRG